MAVLMTAHIPGGTQDMIDGMEPLLGPIRSMKGFIVHTNGQTGALRLACRRGLGLAGRLRGMVRGQRQAGVSRGRRAAVDHI